MLYKNWLYEWLENYVKPSSKIRTYERYKQIVDMHIASTIGDYELNDITPSLLQNLVAELLNNGNKRTFTGLSANSVYSVISVLQNSLKTANMLCYTKTYVADKIIRPKTTEKQVECFSLSEQKKIEAYCMQSKKKKLYGIVICLYTGLRIGELLALKFSDIDFNKLIMYISKTCHDSPNGRIIETPKTNSSNRIIPLPKQILGLIKELKRDSHSEYLIADLEKPVAVRSYQRTFELLLKRLNIQHKGFHSLRHTFATRALECGMDVKTLSELLGHKNTSITLNRYVHSMLEHKTDMMNKLAKNLTKMSTD
ncbi:MAG: tyrosine-type recombinase/integrase [Christensenellales bacterium]